MRNFLVCSLAAVSLVACGGGNGLDSSLVPSNGAYTYTYTSSDRAYLVTSTEVGSTAPGRRQIANTYSDSSPYELYDMGPARYSIYPLGMSASGDGSVCTYSPTPAFPTPPFSVGQTWTVTYNESCAIPGLVTTLPITTITIKGTVSAIERVITPAGTFPSYKIITNQTVRTNDSTTTYTGNRWVSQELSATVRYQGTWTVVQNSGASTQGSESKELIGVSNGNFAGSNYPVARFAGNWSLRLSSGGRLQNCTLGVSSNGAVSGTCASVNPTFAPITLAGQVTMNGAFQASINDGSTLTGVLDSPLTGSGQWRIPGTLSSAAWTAAHQ